MPTKKRRILNGQAQGNVWNACQYRIAKASGWIAVERGLYRTTFTVCVRDEEGSVSVGNMALPYDLYLEAERLLNFSQSTKDRVGRARVTVISKLLRHLLRARYGAATEFGTLLRKMFEKTKLEEE